MTATSNVARSSFGTPKGKQIRRDPKSVHVQRLFAREQGVVVLVGYGIKVTVDRGHLVLEDGIGPDRRAGCFPRVHHGLRRVVVIGADGFVSLSALEWLADQKISLAMLERDGRVLLNTGPVALSDTRLRRAQALAQDSSAAVDIVRELINRKLSGQQSVVSDKLGNSGVADSLSSFQQQLAAADTINGIRQIEGKAGFTYWATWKDVAVQFPKSDLARVPDHWKTFGARHSQLSYNARKATNPINAILNYLYAVLESETRLAINALGLDPGFGLLHMDAATRDSLVYDLMEPIRPVVDSYVLDSISASPLKRSFFFEEADGTCRLMASFAIELSQTAVIWGQRIAPIVEWFAQQLCSTVSNGKNVRGPGTRITQQKRKDAKRIGLPAQRELVASQNFCRVCGDPISITNRYCGICAVEASTEAIETATDASNNPESLKKRSDKMHAHRNSIREWSPDELPSWLTIEFYTLRIQPLLRTVRRKDIRLAIGVSELYARNIASGKVIPHKRHWIKLAELARV